MSESHGYYNIKENTIYRVICILTHTHTYIYIDTHVFYHTHTHTYRYIYSTEWGPQSIAFIAFSCLISCLNSMVYGRYHELVDGCFYEVYKPTYTVTGENHPRDQRFWFRFLGGGKNEVSAFT